MSDIKALPTIGFNRTELFPWSPIDDQDKEFWCERLGLNVKLTANVESRGTYYVTVVGQNKHRVYPVQGHELILADAPGAKRFIASKEGDFFPINRTSWTQIKNFLVENFIPSYAWGNTGDKTSEQIKQDMIALAKNPRTGFGRLVEQDKENNGYFVDKTTFSERMKIHNEQFPWMKLAEFLDFSIPMT